MTLGAIWKTYNVVRARDPFGQHRKTCSCRFSCDVVIYSNIKIEESYLSYHGLSFCQGKKMTFYKVGASTGFLVLTFELPIFCDW